MPRFIFPSDRTAFLYTGAGEPIRQPFMTGIEFFLEEECENLADILMPDEDPVPGSLLFIGEDGLLPKWLGPEDVTILWAKPPQDPAYPVYADVDQRLVTLENQVWETTAGAQAKANTAESDANVYTDNKIAALVGTAPALLNTLGEISDALNDDEEVFTTLVNQITQALADANAYADLRTETHTFSLTGAPLEVRTGTKKHYNDSGRNWYVVAARVFVETPPTGASLIVDVNINGTSVWTDPDDRLILPAGSATLRRTSFDIIAVPDGGYLTVDVDQVGSTEPGEEMLVTVVTVEGDTPPPED